MFSYRHRFTGSVLLPLLSASFQSPHRHIDRTFSMVTKYKPQDDRHLVSMEEVISLSVIYACVETPEFDEREFCLDFHPRFGR